MKQISRGSSLGQASGKTPGLFRRSVLVMACATLLAGNAFAAFPERVVKVVVPQPPGGPADATGRLLAQKLGEIWGVPVVVENKPGADMQIAGSFVARAPADGYTLMLASVTFTMSRGLYATLPYEPLKDFTWISGFTRSPMLLVTAAKNPATNANELMADARAHPGKQNFASVSSLNFVGGEMLKKSAGVQVTHVPYKGSAASAIAIATGEATWTFDSLATVRPMVDAQRLKILAITGDKRLPQLPDVPTLDELGMKDMLITSWFGVTGPAGMDPVIVRKINADVQTVMANPEVLQRMRDIGMAPMSGSADAYSDFVKTEFTRFETLIKANNLQVKR